MRAIINFAAGLFVVLGALGFVVGVVMTFALFSGPDGMGGAAAMAGITALLTVASSASCILVGGATWLLGSIDSRLAKLAGKSRRVDLLAEASTSNPLGSNNS
jgi:hypothetical protein